MQTYSVSWQHGRVAQDAHRTLGTNAVCTESHATAVYLPGTIHHIISCAAHLCIVLECFGDIPRHARQ